MQAICRDVEQLKVGLTGTSDRLSSYEEYTGGIVTRLVERVFAIESEVFRAAPPRRGLLARLFRRR